MINVKYFILGAGLGAFVTYTVMKRQYEIKLQDEIMLYHKQTQEKAEPKVETPVCNKDESKIMHFTEDKSEPGIDITQKVVTKLGYKDYSEFSKAPSDTEKTVDEKNNKPYLISPNEYGEIEDYDQIGLTYYANGVLVDEDEVVVDNIDKKIGSDFPEYFGKFEDDAVHIRNDKLKADYEILYDASDFY